jgi:hypothetical protein
VHEAELVTPGLVDAHTHAPWAGSRHEEYALRMAGADYETIAKAGGGIVSTMRAVRAATQEQLTSALTSRLARMASLGVTTVEAKSGYGLDLASERKQLVAIRDASTRRGAPRVVPTYLALHALPPEAGGDRGAYAARVAAHDFEALASEGLFRFVDAYVERSAFSVEQVRPLVEKATARGFGVRLHVGQFADVGGAQLAAAVGACSVDHLEHVGPDGVRALAAAGVRAVLLPVASFRVFVNRNLRWLGHRLGGLRHGLHPRHLQPGRDRSALHRGDGEEARRPRLPRRGARGGDYDPSTSPSAGCSSTSARHILKMDRFKVVQKGYHGLRELTREELRALYQPRKDPPRRRRATTGSTRSTRSPRRRSTRASSTLRELRHARRLRRRSSPTSASASTRPTATAPSSTRSNDLPRYVERDPLLARRRSTSCARRARSSSCSPTPLAVHRADDDLPARRAMPEYPSFRHYFDVMVVASQKPAFFQERRPARARDADARSAPPAFRSSAAPSTRAATSSISSASSASRATASSTWAITSTATSCARRRSAWRTAMIIQEMEAEVLAHEACRDRAGEAAELEEPTRGARGRAALLPAALQGPERRLEEARSGRTAPRSTRPSATVKRTVERIRGQLRADRRRARQAGAGDRRALPPLLGLAPQGGQRDLELRRSGRGVRLPLHLARLEPARLLPAAILPQRATSLAPDFLRGSARENPKGPATAGAREKKNGALHLFAWGGPHATSLAPDFLRGSARENPKGPALAGAREKKNRALHLFAWGGPHATSLAPDFLRGSARENPKGPATAGAREKKNRALHLFAWGGPHATSLAPDFLRGSARENPKGPATAGAREKKNGALHLFAWGGPHATSLAPDFLRGSARENPKGPALAGAREKKNYYPFFFAFFLDDACLSEGLSSALADLSLFADLSRSLTSLSIRFCSSPPWQHRKPVE